MKFKLAILIAGWAAVAITQTPPIIQNLSEDDAAFLANLTGKDLEDTVWQSHSIGNGITKENGFIYYAIRMLGRAYASHGLNSAVSRSTYTVSGEGVCCIFHPSDRHFAL